ncbi:hypothetical protein TNCV_4476281 [Trichonephila clavipes]|nr:hypothetical protein TNCV_4476281 [Trichonephila clavipes]
MSDIGPFPGYFLDDKRYHSRQIGWRLQSDNRLNLLSSENSTHASPIQSIVMLTTPLQTGSTVLSGQWDTHTGLRAYSPPPLKRLATVFREICFPEAQQETDLPPASGELWCTVPFADRTIYLSSAGVVLLTRPPRAVCSHIPVVFK